MSNVTKVIRSRKSRYLPQALCQKSMGSWALLVTCHRISNSVYCHWKHFITDVGIVAAWFLQHHCQCHHHMRGAALTEAEATCCVERWRRDLNLGTPVSRPRVLTSGKPPMSLSLSQCHTYVRTLFAEWHCCGHAEFSIIWKTMCKTICRTSTCVLLLVNRVLQWWHRYISLCTIIRCVAIRFFKLGPSIRIFVDKHLNYTWGDHLETPVAT